MDLASPPRRRLRLVVALATLGLALAACGSTSSDGSDEPDDGDGATTAAALDVAADDIVWQEFTGGGFVMAEAAAGEVPAVQILGDGRIFVTEPGDGASARSAAVRSGAIERDALADFLADAEGSGLFEPGVDFGQPGITDQPTTTINLFRGDIPLIVSVYALGVDLDGPGALDREQLAHREQLAQLLARARGLTDDLQPYVPERVRVTLLPASEPSPPPVADAAPAWPGPPISEIEAHVGHHHPGDEHTDEEHAAEAEGAFACLPVEGDDAAALDEAAATNPTSWWRLADGSARQLVVSPILPGDEECPEG